MKYTKNYQLTQWEKPDRIVMSDFNGDNAKLEAALTTQNSRLTSEAARLDGRVNTEAARLEALAATAPRVLFSQSGTGHVVEFPVSGLSGHTALRLLFWGRTSSGANTFLQFNTTSGQSYYCQRVNDNDSMTSDKLFLGRTETGGSILDVWFYEISGGIAVLANAVGRNTTLVTTTSYRGIAPGFSFGGLYKLIFTQGTETRETFTSGTRMKLLGYKF